MAERSIIAAVADDHWQRDVIATGHALAAATGLRAVFAHVEQTELVPASSVLPVGEAAWSPFVESGFHEAQRRAEERGRRFVAEVAIDPDDSYVTVGDPAVELRRIATETRAEAIVVGAPAGGGLSAAGSVTWVLSHAGDCPVIVARPGADLRLRHGPIVCGVDPMADDARRVVRAAARFSAMLMRPLIVTYVGEFRNGGGPGISYETLLHASRRSALQGLHRAVEGLPDGLPLELMLESGEPADRLNRLAEERDAALIVVGCRGHGALRSALRGSVSLDLSRSACRALAVIPPAAGDEGDDVPSPRRGWGRRKSPEVPPAS